MKINEFEWFRFRYLRDPSVLDRAKDMFKVLDGMDPVKALSIIKDLEHMFTMKVNEGAL
jgi:hypothetical protein